jgi:hypothetical protein
LKTANVDGLLQSTGLVITVVVANRHFDGPGKPYSFISALKMAVFAQVRIYKDDE